MTGANPEHAREYSRWAEKGAAGIYGGTMATMCGALQPQVVMRDRVIASRRLLLTSYGR